MDLMRLSSRAIFHLHEAWIRIPNAARSEAGGLDTVRKCNTCTTSHHFDERFPLRPALGFPASAALPPPHDQGYGFKGGRLNSYQRPAKVLTFFRQRNIQSLLVTNVSSSGSSSSKIMLDQVLVHTIIILKSYTVNLET